MKGYYCVKAFFFGSSLTMSVNVLHRVQIGDVFDSAIGYFRTKSKYKVKELELYESESDMHALKNCKSRLIIKEPKLVAL